ncbi:MAG: AAA family ATPase [Gammaproteobacteria bacterium]|nr:AAA family ATPase [Gammaproteobacteria bacterium]MXX07306.1 AAA family ATPase [Gammaproteobacteria bacterium]MYA35139.1 AAA family ATPase [Gammaproteobacteria bacterium]MYE30806.1 AAA family ATPase [Gammaproteobacteria bacterium]MYK43260.1 AAA family ATPase [Gammaproteobacteria bacterium]
MRLIRLEIENFKSIGKRQSIELRPITLLFGPNSVGKSTVLQAVQYFCEVLNGNFGKNSASINGYQSLGGFTSLVHRQDIGKAIKIKVIFSLNEHYRSDFFGINESSERCETIPINYVNGNKLSEGKIFELAVELEVCWRTTTVGPFTSNKPWVAYLKVELNGKLFYEISSVHSHSIYSTSKIKFNFGHWLLKKLEKSTIAEFQQDDLTSDTESNLDDNIVKFDISSGQSKKWRENVKFRYKSYFKEQEELSPLALEIQELSGLLDEKEEIEISNIGVNSQIFANGSAPNLSENVELPLEIPEIISSRESHDENRKERHRNLRELLNELILSPVRAAYGYLSETVHIGSIREIPGKNYKSLGQPKVSNWKNGLAAWDMICSKNDLGLTDLVNNWLDEDVGKFDTGYRIEKFDAKQIPDDSELAKFLTGEIDILNLEKLRALYMSLPTQTGFRLRDTKHNILVDAVDVGTGVSQMIPVVVAVLSDNFPGLVAIEQPELHVHPKIQVVMGDMFIRGIIGENGDAGPYTSHKTLLIETHSEHIMLRLLRRVREHSESMAPSGFALKPDDLSVVYVEYGVAGARFQRICVTSEGDFKNRWPQGFFRERAEELF